MTGKKVTVKGVAKAAEMGAITGVALGAVGKVATKVVKAASKAVKATKVGVKVTKGVATIKVAGTAIKHSKQVTKLIKNASKLKRTATVMKNIASRPYINSTQTIQNIMRAGEPIADSSLKNGLKWVVKGTFNGTSGTYELVVDVTRNTIVHFLFKGGK